MAKKKTTTKKKTSSRRAASSRSARSSTKKKTTTDGRTSKKRTAKKSSARKTKTKSKKKTSKKKTSKKKSRPTSARKKKTASRAASTKKQSSKKKKTTKKKTTTAKKKKKTAATTSSKKKTKTATKSKKTTSKKKTSKKKSRSSSQRNGSSGGTKKTFSVAEAAANAKADAQGYVFINGRRVRMISAKPAAANSKKTSSRTKSTVAAAEPEKPKIGKTKLTRKELNHYKKLLLEKRRELVGDLDTIEQEALHNVGSGSHMPIHMADIGSDTYDQDFMLGLAENERKHLREIDEALMRIKDGTYGVCRMTGEQIPTARLDAKPWAKYTIEAARKIEGGYPA